jgi:hypothetical protein
VIYVAKTYARYLRYALSTFSSVGFAASTGGALD